MKKKLFGVLITCCAIVLVGCGKDEELKTTKCTLTKNDVINNYQLESTYEINYVGDVVKTVKSTEKVSSNDSNVIDSFETSLEATYSKLKEAYGGYEYDIKKEDGKVTSEVTVDYEKIDLDKLASDDPSMSNMLNDDKKLEKDELQETYEQIGAKCEDVK